MNTSSSNNMNSQYQNTTDTSAAVTYICGKCGNDVELKSTDPLICKECQGRIFYKRELEEQFNFKQFKYE